MSSFAINQFKKSKVNTMKRKSLIQVTFSLILALALIITTMVISPGVASAQQDTSTTPLDALERGIEYDNQGDVDNAKLSYEEAIRLASPLLEVFITAKQRLATIKESQDDIEKADKLREESIYGIKALAKVTRDSRDCTDCEVGSSSGDYNGSGSAMYCDPCINP